MEDIACMSLNEKFPWLMTFCNKFHKGYVDEQDLLKNLKNELECISVVGKKRKEELFEVIRNLFLHFWWRMRWKQAHTWKKYWKKEGIVIERNDDGCKLIAKLLEFVIYAGIILSKGNAHSPQIMKIMQIIRLLPDYDDILCTSLLSLSVKKKFRPAYIAILKSVLIFQIPQYVTEPVTFIKIMMLFKKLKMLIRDKNERILLMASAKKFRGPPCLISWISSFNFDVSKIQENKISQQLLKKSCKGLLKNLKSVIEGQEILSGAKWSDCSSAFFYISDYSTDFENQLKSDVQNDTCCQNKEIKPEEGISETRISVNSPPPICDLDGSIEDYSFNTEFSSSVCLFCDKTTHEEVCLKKSVIIENKDNNINDNSPSFIHSVNLVLCDKKETLSKAKEKGRKAKLLNKTSVIHKNDKNHDCLEDVSTTSMPKVESVDISLSKDSFTKSKSDNSNLIMALSEKFPERCDTDRNNQKKRKIRYDESTSKKKFASKKDEDVSAILETNQVYSDSLPSISLPVSNSSIAEDFLHDSNLIPDLNMFDNAALSVSNGHGISKIKGDCNKVNAKNSQIALPSIVPKNITKCDMLEKSDKFIEMAETKYKKPAPVNVKKYKFYNPDAIDHYNLSETESGTDYPALDSTRVAVRQEKQENSYANLALFDTDSEFGDIFSKPSDIPLYDYSSDVECLLKDIPENEAFPINDEESVQLLVNSVVEKVSCRLDNANLAKQATNNFNMFLEKIHNDQQLELTLDKLNKDLDDIAAHLTHCTTNDFSIDSKLTNESSFSNNTLSENVSLNKTAMTENFPPLSFSTSSQLSSSDGQWCGSLNQSTLTINCNLSDIGSNDSQININPIDSLVPLKIVINLNTQKSDVSQRQCFESDFNSSVPSNCSSNNVIHFHGTYSQATTTSDERQFFSPSPPLLERQSFSPSLERQSFSPSLERQSFSPSLERPSFSPSSVDERPSFFPSHPSVDETQIFSPYLDESPSFSPSHSSDDERLFFSPYHSSVDEREAFSPSLVSHEGPQKYEYQQTEHKSTESICNSPNFRERSPQEAEIYSGCDNSLNSVDSFSKGNETTTCNSPIWEVPNAEANQSEVEKGAPSNAVQVSAPSSPSPSPSNKSVASGKCDEEIYISVDEFAITNSNPISVEYRSKLRPRNKTSKPDFIGISKGDLLSVSDTKRKKRKGIKKKPSRNKAANIFVSKSPQPELNSENQQWNGTKLRLRNKKLQPEFLVISKGIVSELDTQGEVLPEDVTNVSSMHGTVTNYSLSKSKSAYVVQWLIENYETAENVKLNRSTMYSQYKKYCVIHRRKWILSYTSFNKLVPYVFDGVENLGERCYWTYYFGLRKKLSLNQKSKNRSELKQPTLKHKSFNSRPSQEDGKYNF